MLQWGLFFGLNEETEKCDIVKVVGHNIGSVQKHHFRHAFRTTLLSLFCKFRKYSTLTHWLCTSRKPVTGRDQPWRHHFWPNLALSILNFCSFWAFQWYPDLINGAWDMHKNAQKVEWETQSKISYHCLDDASLEAFLTASKPSRRSITAAKRKENEKKERRKKNLKNRKA